MRGGARKGRFTANVMGFCRGKQFLRYGRAISHSLRSTLTCGNVDLSSSDGRNGKEMDGWK